MGLLLIRSAQSTAQSRFGHHEESLSPADSVVYLVSGSIDGPVQCVRESAVDVVELDMGFPITDARAFNSGFKRLRGRAPGIFYVR